MHAGGCPGTLQTGLREWCIGRPSGLPDAPTPVSPQCTCATDFPSEILRPYYRCADHPSLVAGSRVDPVQARCHGVQSATWTCTKLPRATCPRRRCAWSSSTPLRRHESHLGAASHVHHRRQSSLPDRCPTNLEFSTRRRYLRCQPSRKSWKDIYSVNRLAFVTDIYTCSGPCTCSAIT